MIAERTVQASARTLHWGTSGAMGGGRVVYFPSWEALASMPPEQLKAWLLSQQHGGDCRGDANYLAMVGATGGTHRGPANAQLPASGPGDRAARAEAVRAEQATETKSYEELRQELAQVKAELKAMQAM